MANVYAIKAGNWSDPTVWNTGSLPTTADDVFSNNFRVVVNVSATVLSVRNTSSTGIVANGGFDLADGVTLTATSGGFISGATSNNGARLISFAISLSGNASLVGNITPSSVSDATPTVEHSGTGTLNIIGNIFTVSRSGNSGILISNTGTLNFTGNLFSSTTVSSTSVPIRITGNATVNVTGDLIWQCSVPSSSNSLILITAAAKLNVTGTVYGGVNAGVSSSAASNITIVGPIIAGKIVGGTLESVAFISTSSLSINLLTGPFICTSYGTMPYLVTRMHLIPTTTSYFEFRDETTNGALAPGAIAPATRMISPSAASDAPSVSNVRFGTVYALGSQTGTVRIPHPNQVSYGVPVDNTFGAAVLTPQAVWDHLISNINVEDSIGERLKNVSTVQTTGNQISSLL